MPVYTFKDVIEEQKKPLEYRIEKAKEVIAEAFKISEGGYRLLFLAEKTQQYFGTLSKHISLIKATM